MKRVEFTESVSLAGWQRCGGRCEGRLANGERCDLKLFPGKFRKDHILPLALGGTSTLDNLQFLCLACDAVKTNGGDIPQIAKADRQQATWLGLKVPKGQRMPGSRGTKFRRKMDGTVVARPFRH